MAFKRKRVMPNATRLRVKPQLKTASSPLSCRKSFWSRNERLKTTSSRRTRLMSEILKDPRSFLLGGDPVVLGRPRPVSGRTDLSWTLLKSENQYTHHVTMTQALDVMHECFAPSEDPVTGRDVAEDVIFNSARDFYTAVLEKEGRVATVANVRVHGDKLAEAPLVATGFAFQRQGLCKLLMSEIEKWLKISGVERLVLPSMESTVQTWTSSSMGFEVMTEYDTTDLLIEGYDLLDFKDTVMCQKYLNLKKSNKIEKFDSRSVLSSDGSTISHEAQSLKVAMGSFIPVR